MFFIIDLKRFDIYFYNYIKKLYNKFEFLEN